MGLPPVPIDAAGHFEISLRYESSEPGGMIPQKLPVALLVDDPDFFTIYREEGTANLLERIRRSSQWSDVERLRELERQFRNADAGAQEIARQLRARDLQLRAQAINPNSSAEELTDLARTYIAEGRGAEAVGWARRAEAASGQAYSWDRAKVLDTVAHAEYSAGEWQRAADAWTRLLEEAPNYFSDYAGDVTCGTDRMLLNEARRRAAVSRQ
jgi:tetratricopeptide (TPR) repeat protein